MTAKYFHTILLGAALTTAIAGGARADSKGQEVRRDKQEVKQDLPEMKQTRVTIKKLSHGIDLWHDANLKGSLDNVLKYKEMIYEIIRADIAHSVGAVSACEREVELAKREARATEPGHVSTLKGRKLLRDEVGKLKSARELVKAKEILFVSLKRSRAFSNKYRLVNDYLELLKRELGIERIELADDFGAAGK